MSAFLNDLASLLTLAFAFSTMLSMGLALTVGEIVGPLRNVRFVLAALIVNFVILPIAAVLLSAVLGLSADLRIGLLLVASAGGAPMVPKLVQIAKGDAAEAVALTVLLIVATVVFLPLALPILLPGVVVDSSSIVQSLAAQMLLPLAIGLFARARYEEEADAYRSNVAQISNVSLALLFVVSFGRNLGGVLSLLGSGGILAIILLVATAGVASYLLAIPAGVQRRLLVLGSAQRNLAATFIVATANFADRPDVLVYLATAALILMLILFPLAGEWSKRPSRLSFAGSRH